ncbi:MAG: AAA family ATPase [Chloroflexi bacterium]|nr:AAA family ATPase [Chloroflexota bacterium]
MLINSLHIGNILSFKDTKLDLQPLNVLIGPNGSGKSNLIDVIALLQALPVDLPGYFRRSGSIGDWVRNAERNSGSTFSLPEVTAMLDNYGSPDTPLEYELSLGVRNDRESYHVIAERLETPIEAPDGKRAFSFFKMQNGQGRIYSQSSPFLSDAIRTELTPENIGRGRSVLSEIRDPINYPTLTLTARRLASIRIYRDWQVGPTNPTRRSQPTDGPVDFLEEDFSNLALVVNDLRERQGLGALMDEYLERFYESYQSLHTPVHDSSIRIAVREAGTTTPLPASRLSDGTIRFIALLAILCHPEPPPLICIEEPEIAMHPDSVDLVAELLRKAAERTQIIVTTHSPWLIGRFSAEPEAVVVCDIDATEGTWFHRLSHKEVEDWFDGDRDLGDIWMSGAIKGVRW